MKVPGSILGLGISQKLLFDAGVAQVTSMGFEPAQLALVFPVSSQSVERESTTLMLIDCVLSRYGIEVGLHRNDVVYH